LRLVVGVLWVAVAEVGGVDDDELEVQLVVGLHDHKVGVSAQPLVHAVALELGHEHHSVLGNARLSGVPFHRQVRDQLGSTLLHF